MNRHGSAVVSFRLKLPSAAGTPSKWRSTNTIPGANLARRADKVHHNNGETRLKYGIIARTFWGSLLTVRLHCDMRIEMVQGAVGFFASVPATLVHALNLLVTPARSLVLLRAGNGDKRVNGRERVTSLRVLLA